MKAWLIGLLYTIWKRVGWRCGWIAFIDPWEHEPYDD